MSSTARLLHTIATVSAWARGDAEAVEVLIKGQGPDMYADLLDFTLMILIQNTEGNPTAYLEWLSQQALAVQAQESG